MSVVARRPAESAGGAVGIAGVVYGVADGNWPAAVVALAGLVPAVVTFWVTHGGAQGIWRLIVSGRAQ